MTTESQRGTATIYSFPARGRFAAGADPGLAKAAGDRRDVPTVIGSGWYHEEAIREERASKNR
jgi:hypothetical protein